MFYILRQLLSGLDVSTRLPIQLVVISYVELRRWQATMQSKTKMNKNGNGYSFFG